MHRAQELSENQDYVEAEDEFDVNKRPSPPRDDVDCEDEVEVDIFTRKPLLVFSSDEEDAGSEEPLMWLPAVSEKVALPVMAVT